MCEHHDRLSELLAVTSLASYQKFIGAEISTTDRIVGEKLMFRTSIELSKHTVSRYKCMCDRLSVLGSPHRVQVAKWVQHHFSMSMEHKFEFRTKLENCGHVGAPNFVYTSPRDSCYTPDRFILIKKGAKLIVPQWLQRPAQHKCWVAAPAWICMKSYQFITS